MYIHRPSLSFIRSGCVEIDGHSLSSFGRLHRLIGMIPRRRCGHALIALGLCSYLIFSSTSCSSSTPGVSSRPPAPVGPITTASTTPQRPAPESVTLASQDELITRAEASVDRAENDEAENARLIVERLHRIMLHGSRTERPIATLLLSMAYDH